MTTRRLVRAAATVLLAAGLMGTGVTVAAAHPLGNLSVNTYEGVVVGAASTRIEHVEDLAELPALAAVRAADRDGDGDLSDGDGETWARDRCAAAAGRIRLARDGVPARLEVGTAMVTQRPGQAGLPLIRLECSLTDARALLSRPTRLDVAVAPVSDLGWREITVSGGTGAAVASSDVPARSSSGRLTRYPEPATSRLDVRAASAMVAAGGPAAAVAGPSVGPVGPVPPDVRVPAPGPLAAWFDAALRRVLGEVGGTTSPGPAALAVLLVAAALLGAVHAVAPGHGKTVMAAAVIATAQPSRWARIRDAVAIGATVTGAHTGSVLVLAAVLWTLGATVPARLMGGLEAVSGLLVVVVGASLLRSARRRGSGTAGHGHSHDHHGHGHGHDHGHDHHNHVHGHGHRGGTGGNLGGRRILGLGLAGGLTPSPSALILLLAATAAGHPWAGALAVVAFGAGMAATLTAVGLVAGLLAERWLQRQLPAALGRLLGDGRLAAFRPVARVTPLMPPLAVVLAGGLLVVRGVGAV